MNNIISLTGAKHSGQLRLAFRLEENSAVGFVRPYTDRPYNSVWSDCYNFVSNEVLDTMIEEKEVLYKTIIHGHRYVFFKEQLTETYNILILDDYGVAELSTKYSNDLYSIKVVSEDEKDSSRVGVYLYNHEFDKVFDYDKDSVEELEWEIESNLPLK